MKRVPLSVFFHIWRGIAQRIAFDEHCREIGIRRCFSRDAINECIGGDSSHSFDILRNDRYGRGNETEVLVIVENDKREIGADCLVA